MRRRQFISGVVATGAASLVSACAYYGGPGYGPPPHAPAHGHRYRNPHGANLVYDAGLGVYVVVGRVDYYYLDGFYYRLVRDSWQVSQRLDGGWRGYDYDRLPPGLRRRGGPGPGRGRGHR